MIGMHKKTIFWAGLSAVVSATVTWIVTSRIVDGNKAVESQTGEIFQTIPSRTEIHPEVSRGGQNPNRQTVPLTGENLTNIRRTGPSDPIKSAIDVAESTSDFAALRLAFDGLSQNERIGRFQEIVSVFSKFGPKHDIAEKMEILGKVNAPASTLETFKRKILEAEARERYGAMKDDGILASLPDQEFGYVCRALASSRTKQGFNCVDDGYSESAKRTAAKMVAQYSIQAGTMEASKEIAALPPGIIRDEAAAEMVIWLRKTGSEDEAAPWLETIQDEKAKARAMGK